MPVWWTDLCSRRWIRCAICVSAVALVVAVASYSGFWLFAAHRVRSEFAAFAAASRTRNVACSWQALAVGGYPFRLRVEVTDLRVNGPDLDAAAPQLVASSSPFDLSNWRFALPNGLGATPGTGRPPFVQINANSATGAVSLRPDGGVTIWLTLQEAAIDPALVGRLAIGEAITWLILPAELPRSAGDPYLEFGADLREITVQAAPPPFSNNIDDVAVGLVVLGPVTNASFADAARAWREAGGTVKLDHFGLEWDKLYITGDGKVTLDADLQPNGSVAATIAGYDQLLTALSVAGLMPASDLTPMRIGLAMIGPAISTYFTVKDGDMFLGPANLGKAPRLQWK